MTSEQAAKILWKKCHKSMRGWMEAILYYGKEAIEEAYQRGLEDGRRGSQGKDKA
jgi:hypothetical protein